RYMAPELVDGARSTVASDMYALGITLFELTLGAYPYRNAVTTVREQFDQHRLDSVAFPQPWPTDIPEGWKAILSRLLAKGADGRYSDYGRLQAAIRRFEPRKRLPAALLPRGLAWAFDLALLAVAMAAVGFGLSRAGAGHFAIDFARATA